MEKDKREGLGLSLEEKMEDEKRRVLFADFYEFLMVVEKVYGKRGLKAKK